MSRRQKMLRGLLIACLAILILACGPDASIHANLADAKIYPMGEIPADAERVEVGIYTTIIDGLDIASSTYDLTAYVWFKWKGDIDPTAHMELSNLTQRYDFTKEPLYEKPLTLPDGRQYQVMQIHGRFFQPFDLKDFPFDKQSIAIIIQDEYRAHENLVYLPDMNQSGFAADLAIPGWRVLGWRAGPVIRDYGSRFGAPDTHLSSRYPALQYEIVIGRHANFFLWKLLMPLLIVLAANWMALLIDPELVDVRTALPATSMLTLVFLQQTYTSELPEVGSLVLMDKIYVLAYVVVVSTLIEVIATASWQKSSEKITDARVSRVDRYTLAAQIGVFFGSVIALLAAADSLA
ncbi:MAG: hypothetical protein GC166_04365 [Alphaproteobacteria bacterium]|nr:hypothetical protein [Alphaproteobacteria bacterium]